MSSRNLLIFLPLSIVFVAGVLHFQNNDAAANMSPRELRNMERIEQLDKTRLPEHKGPRISDRFPDIVLTDQYGEQHRFVSDLVKDHAVCLVLFYTQCTGTCPGTAQMMKQLRISMEGKFRSDEVRFISITLDPDIDDPGVLMDYAESRGLGPEEGLADWYFLTGNFEELEKLRRALGLYDLDPEIDADRTEHASLITFGNDRYNRWVSMPVGLGFDALDETFYRICGVSERQRFERAFMQGRIRADNPSTVESCCETGNGSADCCGTAGKTSSNVSDH